ncbi:hypothetical protein D9753_06640 [Streptomyces dangxiongensis]|uniref:Aminoacyl-transfer RNA synthetases class-II family profile domain-containing protein n=1 Tax=Streptomyces dangxiongensis TaxID=1442032 RepID=A0A3G2JG79_9ACTN|nr:hypothetical protein [Streptomyces dangxiongensis]AYN38647.1 hypothetical protein D9753_06640 [Streptomyces dangxiongensis]
MTAHAASVTRTDALAILDPDQTDLLRELDGVFAGWGRTAGAREILPPPVYPVEDLAKFDVYTNFPHLALVAAPLELAGGPAEPSDGRFAPDGLREARLGLPHATCFGAYLFYEDVELDQDTLVTLVNRCFRNEDHYVPLRRLASFQMREIVALGSYDHTQRLLAEFTERIIAFGAALGVALERVAASDPFFENDGARALLSRLSPVKYEFQAGDLAIASVNTHRNFFGERCRIRLAGEDGYAYTSCVAFGLERWLAVLLDAHGSAPQALAAVRDAATRLP